VATWISSEYLDAKLELRLGVAARIQETGSGERAIGIRPRQIGREKARAEFKKGESDADGH
jgi:hypothetical protein